MGIVTPNVSPSNIPRQLSDGNDQGTTFGFAPVGAQGGASADKIGFFGSVTSQPSGASLELIGVLPAGSLATIATSQSPSGAVSQNTGEQSLTVAPSATSEWQIVAGDILYISKTAQAGLGYGNLRVSGANAIGITFSNFTTAVVTPTAAEKYGVVAIRGVSPTTQALTPAVVGPNTTAEQVFTVAGIDSGNVLQVSKPTAQAGLDIVGCRVAGDNQIGITFANLTTAAITPTAAESYTIWDMGGLSAISNFMFVAANIVAPAGAVSQGTTESNTLLIGLNSTDTIVGVSKPTLQQIGVGGARVSAVNQFAVTYINPSTQVVTPTANEIYGLDVFRPQPLPPVMQYAPALSPVGVAGNTTAEQTFTLSGTVLNSPAWVNKRSAQTGLGIVGCRVSAVNTISINFCNTTSNTITPTAGEVYDILNFQQAVPNVGSAWVQQIDPTAIENETLTNAVQAALVKLGLVAAT